MSSICRTATPLVAAALGVTLFATPSAVAQQAYPSQPIRIVVAFPAGGFADGVARIVADRLPSKLGQPVVVDNRPGASGNLAARAVAQSKPDGHTVLLTTTAAAINPTLHKNPGYAADDLRAVSVVGSAPESIVVHPSNPARNLKEFLQLAKSKPTNYGTAGIGTGSYIATTYLFKELAKVDLVHVPFQGGAAAINAAVGNHVDAVALTVSPMVAHITAGKLRALALASRARSPEMPSVPTYAESGFPGFYAASWVGLFVPSKTDNAAVTRLNAAINEIVKEADVRKRVARFGLEPMHGDAKDIAAFVQSETENWGKMVRTLGLSIN